MCQIMFLTKTNSSTPHWNISIFHMLSIFLKNKTKTPFQSYKSTQYITIFKKKLNITNLAIKIEAIVVTV